MSSLSSFTEKLLLAYFEGGNAAQRGASGIKADLENIIAVIKDNSEDDQGLHTRIRLEAGFDPHDAI